MTWTWDTFCDPTPTWTIALYDSLYLRKDPPPHHTFSQGPGYQSWWVTAPEDHCHWAVCPASLESESSIVEEWPWKAGREAKCEQKVHHKFSLLCLDRTWGLYSSELWAFCHQWACFCYLYKVNACKHWPRFLNVLCQKSMLKNVLHCHT